MKNSTRITVALTSSLLFTLSVGVLMCATMGFSRAGSPAEKKTTDAKTTATPDAKKTKDMPPPEGEPVTPKLEPESKKDTGPKIDVVELPPTPETKKSPPEPEAKKPLEPAKKSKGKTKKSAPRVEPTLPATDLNKLLATKADIEAAEARSKAEVAAAEARSKADTAAAIAASETRLKAEIKDLDEKLTQSVQDGLDSANAANAATNLRVDALAEQQKTIVSGLNTANDAIIKLQAAQTATTAAVTTLADQQKQTNTLLTATKATADQAKATADQAKCTADQALALATCAKDTASKALQSAEKARLAAEQSGRNSAQAKTLAAQAAADAKAAREAVEKIAPMLDTFLAQARASQQIINVHFIPAVPTVVYVDRPVFYRVVNTQQVVGYYGGVWFEQTLVPVVYDNRPIYWACR